MAGLRGKSMFSFARNCQAVSQSGCMYDVGVSSCACLLSVYILW